MLDALAYDMQYSTGMNRIEVLSVIALIIGACCAEPTITRTQACEEQAVTWCSRVNAATEGCEATYQQWCDGASAHVRDDAQLRCLEDIVNDAHPDTIPRSCELTWGVVPQQCTSHCAAD